MYVRCPITVFLPSENTEKTSGSVFWTEPDLRFQRRKVAVVYRIMNMHGK